MIKEHILVWRKRFNGPVKYKKGDVIKSTVKSKVSDGMEFFVLQISRDDPEFERCNNDYKEFFNENWDGEYVVPCSHIRFY